MYPDVRLESRMKITFLLSDSFAYSSEKLSFMPFKNLVKNFKSLLNFTVKLFIGLFRSGFFFQHQKIQRLQCIDL